MDTIPSDASKRSASARRAQILNAAATVFAEKGYQRATVKEIAALADVAPGTIYLYFKNKRDLLLVIADHLISQAMKQTLTHMAQMEPRAYLATVLQGFLDFIHENSALLQAIMTEIWIDRELQEQFFTQVVGPIFETGARYLEAQVAENRARPCKADVVIPAIAGSLFMVSLLRVLSPDQFLGNSSTDELVTELTHLYLYGLSPAN